MGMHSLSVIVEPDSSHTVMTESENVPDHLEVSYQTSYAFPINKTSAHLQHAKDLALALLQRHFPESKAFLVESAALGPYSAKGVKFMLKVDNESSSDPDTTPPKKLKSEAKRTHVEYSYQAPWHYIAPENIAAFIVKKGLIKDYDGMKTLTYRTHTSLVVVLDDLATFHRWSRANMNHRGDVLSDTLGVRGKIEKCFGMLFFGPRLELYNYDASNHIQPVKPHGQQNWRMDMRTTSLAAVDAVPGGFVNQEVVYRE